MRSVLLLFSYGDCPPYLMTDEDLFYDSFLIGHWGEFDIIDLDVLNEISVMKLCGALESEME